MIIMMQINNQSKLASYTGLCHILVATLWSHMNKGCHYAPKPIVGNEYIKKVNEFFFVGIFIFLTHEFQLVQSTEQNYT